MAYREEVYVDARSPEPSTSFVKSVWVNSETGNVYIWSTQSNRYKSVQESLTELNGVTIGNITPASGTFTSLASNGGTRLGNGPDDSIELQGSLISDVIPMNSNTASLGSSVKPFKDAYLAGDLVLNGSGSVFFPKRTTAQRPVTNEKGEMSFNTDTNKLEFNNGSRFRPLSDQPTGPSNFSIFYENELTVSEDYTITAGKSAISAGPITVANGVTVTIPIGSTWSIT